jgi:hypothetical protein
LSDYHNETSQSERRATLQNDTYLSRAAGNIGAELGGRFQHLARGQQQVVGTAPSPYPKIPGYWAEADSSVEPSLGMDINAMEPIGGPPETVPARDAETVLAAPSSAYATQVEPTFRRRR